MLKKEVYLKEYGYKTTKILELNKPHPIIKDNRPIEVYYECLFFTNKESRFVLFNDGNFVSNQICFPCEVSQEDRLLIAQEMIDELLSKSDFKDLDRELEGKTPCREYENIYKSCEECPDSKEDAENRCIGALYHIPPHLNSWNVEIKWNKVYGERSENHKRYVTSKMIDSINDFMYICGDRKDLISKVLNYGKNHRANEHKKLFK